MNEPLKTYAAVCDVSPSEQLSGDGDSLKILAVVMGLKTRDSFDLVGDNHPDPEKRLNLRKWAGAPDWYKGKMIEHAFTLADEPQRIMFGAEVASEEAIRRIGLHTWELLQGPCPPPSSFNSKGKPRITLGGYKVDGVEVAPYQVLIDDLIILGWLTDAIGGINSMLERINKAPVRLEVLIDRLPRDPLDNKAIVLKELLRKGKGLTSLMGRPVKSDTMQRDLLVDNLAGVRRELEAGTWKGRSDAADLFRFNRRRS